MYSGIDNSDNEDKMKNSSGRYRSNTSGNSASHPANSGVFESTGPFTIEKPIHAAENKKSEEQEGLSPIEKAALERSMKKHRRAYNLLASD